MKLLPLPAWMKGLKIMVPKGDVTDELAERRAKNREIAECKRLAALTGQRYVEPEDRPEDVYRAPTMEEFEAMAKEMARAARDRR